MSASGRAWVYGDDINTDLLAPAAHLKGSMDILASHCLEAEEKGSAHASVVISPVICPCQRYGIF